MHPHADEVCPCNHLPSFFNIFLLSLFVLSPGRGRGGFRGGRGRAPGAVSRGRGGARGRGRGRGRGGAAAPTTREDLDEQLERYQSGNVEYLDAQLAQYMNKYDGVPADTSAPAADASAPAEN